jgi:FtsP/CotA-like multicopper oxidase with cupredoxin domain
VGAGLLTLPLRDVEAGAASALDPSELPRPFQTPFVQAPTLRPDRSGIDPVDGAPVQYYTLAEVAASAAILPRLKTPILSYNGTFPGPTISVEQGTKTVLRVRNQLPPKHPTQGHDLYSVVHLHGSPSLPQYDGYASDITKPGFRKDYLYDNKQPARTLWYHDHAVHHTAINVYSGLAAQYHLHDPIERALLPQGEFDVALTINDAMFALDGSLGWDNNDHSGLWGDVILVNGRPWPVMKVKKRVYRFRVLNACISRSLRPTLSTGDPVTMVATDGGLMPQSQSVASWRHGPAERYEILIDFRKYTPGQRIVLRNLSNKNNVDYEFTSSIMAFDVVPDTVDTSDPTWNTIPVQLAPSEAMSLQPSATTIERPFKIARNNGLWTVNGLTWQPIIDSGFRDVAANPDLNATEIWEFHNPGGGWYHPMHIHLIDFQILSRNGQPPFAYEKGPKDVVYVGENERVRVLMKFGPHRGRYMIHCHNTVHEDHDMMVQYRVGPEDVVDTITNNPITAAPAQLDTGLS